MRELRCKEVIIPTEPAVFSAWGMLMTDVRRDYIRTLITRTDKVNPKDLDGIYSEMEKQATNELAAEGVRKGDLDIERFADMRYLGQEHTVKVPLPSEKVTENTLPGINDRFHTLHEQTYTFRLETPVELVNYHITAFGRVKKPEIRELNGREGMIDEARKATRRVNFDELGFHEADIYERDSIPVGEPIRGPAVIEEPAATTVVFPDQQLTRDKYGFLHIEPID